LFLNRFSSVKTHVCKQNTALCTKSYKK